MATPEIVIFPINQLEILTGNQLTITWRIQMRSTMNICCEEAFHETDKGYSLENGKKSEPQPRTLSTLEQGNGLNVCH